MSPSRTGLVFDTDTLRPGLAGFADQLDNRIAILMKYEEPKVQSYMRQNAPWTDRTGNARNGLFAKASSSARSHVIQVFHTMPYGVWLEVRWSGRFAIIA